MTKHEILEKIIVKAQACKELKMNPKDVDLFCDEISVLATELQEWLRKPKTKRIVKEFPKTENKPCKWDRSYASKFSTVQGW